MRKEELKYIEQKTGFKTAGGSDNGPAWIGWVKLTKSGRGFYFDGKLFRRIRMLFYSNYRASDGNDYWVSGVKKQGDNRYPWGNQKVKIQASAVSEFLKLRGEEKLDKSKFEVAEMEDAFEVEWADEREERENL